MSGVGPTIERRLKECAQIHYCNHGLDMYYSPNNPVKLETSLYLKPHSLNPFQPDGRRPSGTRYRDLLRPRPWSKAFGWTSFIPTEPCYMRSPRSIISVLQRPPPIEHYSDLDEHHHSFCLAPDNEWRTLEKDIYTAVCALKGAFHLPCVLPFLPHTLGYNISHSQQSTLIHSIRESQEWFLVWIGALSYCLYASEMHPTIIDQPEYPRWRKALEDAGLSNAWIDQVVHSPICDYSSVRRVGCIIDLYNEPGTRPTVPWFEDCGVPVWYLWRYQEDEKARNSSYFASHRPPDNPEPYAYRGYRPLPSMRDSWRADALEIRREVEAAKEGLQAELHGLADDIQGTTVEGEIAPKRTTRIEELEETIEEGEARIKDREAKIREADARLATGREPEWVVFFREREAKYPTILARETAQARQKRLNRMREPPMSSAPVFEWTLDQNSDDDDIWIRVPVPAKWRSDTLANYGEQRKRYDPFFNEWDCCDEFGDITQGEEEEMDGWEQPHDTVVSSPPPVPSSMPVPAQSEPAPASNNAMLPALLPPPPLPSSMSVQVQSEPAHASNDNTLPALDPPLDLFHSTLSPVGSVHPTQNAPTTPYHPDDPLGQEVEEMFGSFYGYVAPVVGTPIPEQSDDKRRDIFFRLLGQAARIDEEKRAAYMSSKPSKPAQFLVDSILDRATNFRGVWDLQDDCVNPVRLRQRFRMLRRVPFDSTANHNSIPSGDDIFDRVQTYYFLQESEPTVSWKLAFISASAALTACRLPDDFTAGDIASWFVQRGVPFRVFYPFQSVTHLFSRPTPTFAIPVRPFDHKFTKEDYDSYIHLRTLVLGQTHMQAALKRGGIVWRLSIGTLGISSVCRASSQWHRTRRVRLGGSELVDDTLTMNELDLICGAYECVSDDGKKRSLKSWWPLARYYEKEECGENYGHWCNRREAWYETRLNSIEMDNFSAKPLTYTEWKSTQHGPRMIRTLHAAIEKSSEELISKYGPVPP